LIVTDRAARVPEIIAKHGRGKPAMVFCATRKASVATASMLAKLWVETHPTRRLWKGPRKEFSLNDNELDGEQVVLHFEQD
jgi:hypothetical protein